MDRIQEMQIFVRVAELCGFTAAAVSLGLPKASVSTAVRRLENRLDTRLLHRTTRRVRLTLDGETFYRRCQDLLADMDELETLFRQDGKALDGRLRVDMPSGMLPDILLSRLPEFLDQHPLLEVGISNSDHFVDPVREGFDCVFRVGGPGDVNLVARHLGDLCFINCASPAYLARHGMPNSLEDLAGHQLIHYVAHLGARSPGFEYPTGDSYASLPMPGAVRVNSINSYESACLAGLGIIQGPEPGLRRLIDEGRLVEILPHLRPEPMPVSLLYAQRRHLARRTLVFMDWAQAILTPLLNDAGQPA